MDEPEPLPAFTFNPDGPATITHADGTVSVNAPRPDGTAVTATTASDGSVTATEADYTSSTALPPEPPDPQPEVTFAVPAPSGSTATPAASTTSSDAGIVADAPAINEPPAWEATPADAPGINEPPAWEATPADAPASDSVVNPDGSITTRLPDGSTQTTVRLPGGATIVTSTTRPGEFTQPPAADPPRSRRWKGRSR